jgi:hypothetical protein
VEDDHLIVREVVAEDPISVPQEITRCGVPWEGLTGLLRGPLRCRVSGNPAVKNPASIMGEHKEQFAVDAWRAP